MRKKPVRKGIPDTFRIGSLPGYNLVDPSVQLPDTPEVRAAVESVCRFLDEVLRNENLGASTRTTIKSITPMVGSTPAITKEILAMSLAITNPNWTTTRIARELGVSRTSVYRWTKFRVIRDGLKEMAQQEMLDRRPRGYRTRGRAGEPALEAYHDTK